MSAPDSREQEVDFGRYGGAARRALVAAGWRASSPGSSLGALLALGGGSVWKARR